eukprot:SAG22_NODE_1055_length_5789_cov_3.943234_5_plen_45_part_00
MEKVYLPRVSESVRDDVALGFYARHDALRAIISTSNYSGIAVAS